MRKKKQTSIFTKVTRFVIWTMLTLTIGSVVLAAIISIM